MLPKSIEYPQATTEVNSLIDDELFDVNRSVETSFQEIIMFNIKRDFERNDRIEVLSYQKEIQIARKYKLDSTLYIDKTTQPALSLMGRLRNLGSVATKPEEITFRTLVHDESLIGAEIFEDGQGGIENIFFLSELDEWTWVQRKKSGETETKRYQVSEEKGVLKIEGELKYEILRNKPEIKEFELDSFILLTRMYTERVLNFYKQSKQTSPSLQ